LRKILFNKINKFILQLFVRLNPIDFRMKTVKMHTLALNKICFEIPPNEDVACARKLKVLPSGPEWTLSKWPKLRILCIKLFLPPIRHKLNLYSTPFSIIRQTIERVPKTTPIIEDMKQCGKLILIRTRWYGYLDV
jgi:hypothetical protein